MLVGEKTAFLSGSSVPSASMARRRSSPKALIEAAAVFAAAGSAGARATSALASSIPAIGASARAIQGSPSLPAIATQP